MWVTINRLMARITGYTTLKATRETMDKIRARSLAQQKSSLKSGSIKRMQGDQAGYPVHQQSVQLPKETWPKQDLKGGQEGRLAIEPAWWDLHPNSPTGECQAPVIEPVAQTPLPTPPKPRRSDRCFLEADKNRASGDNWLAEINDIVGVINRRMENQSTKDIQAHANEGLDLYLEAIEGKRVINPKELEDTDG